jgi:hypothetical protein
MNSARGKPVTLDTMSCWRAATAVWYGIPMRRPQHEEKNGSKTMHRKFGEHSSLFPVGSTDCQLPSTLSFALVFVDRGISYEENT